ncbi:hypothetical protein ASPVEDRAFT_38561 [Aspergillus versicolor CBS 583.65]|uniref:AB hydrolase-1 domain-containing protein n=1 Tax=Aspergillus versicolor CBS 583.65 TaxID=1036611 RepID=A0A1L9PC35_ASPVE|nr:uncharacterized protein ASPVEDRAFT_38561 [Aspergillus versicolor CBS 583.65]OJI99097.1 hypothetical protein ASPVEDRAFT_38561 [Aspergillus versicolor CBS 583.65]
MKLSILTSPLLAALVSAAANQPNTYPTLQLSTDTAFNFEFLTALRNSLTGGSDIGPVLGVAQAIEPGNMTSYADEFLKLAKHTKAQAQDPENAYDPANVRDTWFSASHYFRRADVYLHRNWSSPLLASVWAEQTAAFDKAIASLPIPGQRIRIPATEANFTVEAIWYAAAAPESKSRKLPTLVIANGFDAAQEDSYHYFVAAALARGWNCITYEGPGQPTVRRNQNIGFIPEWERVTTPVVDYILSEKADLVDEDRVVLIGNSLGGYFAARAAAFEKRLAATVLIGGVWDTYAAFTKQLEPEILAVYEAGNYSDFDETVLSLRDAGELSTDATWGLDQGLWAFKTHSPSEFFSRSKKFNLEGVAEKIDMPVFVGDAEFDALYEGQPQKVKDAIGDKATLHRFEGVAGYHCQTGADQELSRTVFAWLNKTLGGA